MFHVKWTIEHNTRIQKSHLYCCLGSGFGAAAWNLLAGSLFHPEVFQALVFFLEQTIQLRMLPQRLAVVTHLPEMVKSPVHIPSKVTRYDRQFQAKWILTEVLCARMNIQIIQIKLSFSTITNWGSISNNLCSVISLGLKVQCKQGEVLNRLSIKREDLFQITDNKEIKLTDRMAYQYFSRP